MAEYIDRDKLYIEVTEKYHDITAGSYPFNVVAHDMAQLVKNAPTEDVVPVVRCRDCKYAVELDKHCEINRASYRHCAMGRGDEEEYVWHKYKKYYKGYSIVELDDYSSYGERRCGE